MTLLYQRKDLKKKPLDFCCCHAMIARLLSYKRLSVMSNNNSAKVSRVFFFLGYMCCIMQRNVERLFLYFLLNSLFFPFFFSPFCEGCFLVRLQFGLW